MNFVKLFGFVIFAISLVGCSGEELSSKVLPSRDDDPRPKSYNEITVKVVAEDSAGQTSEDTITLKVENSIASSLQ